MRAENTCHKNDMWGEANRRHQLRPPSALQAAIRTASAPSGGLGPPGGGTNLLTVSAINSRTHLPSRYKGRCWKPSGLLTPLSSANPPLQNWSFGSGCFLTPLINHFWFCLLHILSCLFFPPISAFTSERISFCTLWQSHARQRTRGGCCMRSPNPRLSAHRLSSAFRRGRSRTQLSLEFFSFAFHANFNCTAGVRTWENSPLFSDHDSLFIFSWELMSWFSLMETALVPQERELIVPLGKFSRRSYLFQEYKPILLLTITACDGFAYERVGNSQETAVC